MGKHYAHRKLIAFTMCCTIVPRNDAHSTSADGAKLTCTRESFCNIFIPPIWLKQHVKCGEKCCPTICVRTPLYIAVLLLVQRKYNWQKKKYWQYCVIYCDVYRNIPIYMAHVLCLLFLLFCIFICLRFVSIGENKSAITHHGPFYELLSINPLSLTEFRCVEHRAYTSQQSPDRTIHLEP